MVHVHGYEHVRAAWYTSAIRYFGEEQRREPKSAKHDTKWIQRLPYAQEKRKRLNDVRPAIKNQRITTSHDHHRKAVNTRAAALNTPICPLKLKAATAPEVVLAAGAEALAEDEVAGTEELVES